MTTPRSTARLRITHRIYDAFPTKSGAAGAVRSLREADPECQPIARKLAEPGKKRGMFVREDDRLRYGVFVKKSCRL